MEVWDLTPLAHPLVWHNFIDSGHKLHEFEGYFPVALKSQLDSRYSKVGRIGYFIDLTGDDYCPLRVKMFLIRNGAIRVSCSVGLLPLDDSQHGLVSKLRGRFAKGPVKAFKGLTMAFVRRLAGPFIRPGLVIVSGRKSILPAGYDYETVRAHALDYDIYLALKSIEVSAEEYAVFVDQDLCCHSDYIREGSPFSVTPSRYFPSVCNGLRKISALLKMGLRIAAHPRASYQQESPDRFEGIPVEYGKTAELIRNCKVVVCHNSTAAQFAVLFRKPIVFVTTDELVPSGDGRDIAEFASVLGKSVVNFDGDLDSVDWRKELSVDDQRYDAYRNEYIKIDGSPEMPFWNIVINHIEKAV